MAVRMPITSISPEGVQVAINLLRQAATSSEPFAFAVVEAGDTPEMVLKQLTSVVGDTGSVITPFLLERLSRTARPGDVLDISFELRAAIEGAEGNLRTGVFSAFQEVSDFTRGLRDTSTLASVVLFPSQLAVDLLADTRSAIIRTDINPLQPNAPKTLRNEANLILGAELAGPLAVGVNQARRTLGSLRGELMLRKSASDIQRLRASGFREEEIRFGLDGEISLDNRQPIEFDTRGPASNISNSERLRTSLARREAEGAFDTRGRLLQDVIERSAEIIPGSELVNPAVIRELTRDGSRIADWAKFTTETFRRPSGKFQVHFYRNRVTGEVNYNIDYKAIISGR